MIESPRAKFLKNSDFVKQHEKLLESAAFERAIEVALMEMTRATLALAGTHDLNEAGAQQAAASTFNMLQGANHFVQVLYALARPYEKQKPAEKIESLN